MPLLCIAHVMTNSPITRIASRVVPLLCIAHVMTNSPITRIASRVVQPKEKRGKIIEEKRGDTESKRFERRAGVCGGAVVGGRLCSGCCGCGELAGLRLHHPPHAARTALHRGSQRTGGRRGEPLALPPSVQLSSSLFP